MLITSEWLTRRFNIDTAVRGYEFVASETSRGATFLKSWQANSSISAPKYVLTLNPNLSPSPKHSPKLPRNSLNPNHLPPNWFRSSRSPRAPGT
jgi:hypothetical protein